MSINLAGGVTGAKQEVETTSLAARVSIRPTDPGALGHYRKSIVSGTIAAGIGAAALVASFRYGGPNICVVKRIAISGGGTATAFTAGGLVFSGFVARAFTANDTGGLVGTLSGNNGKLRTGYATTGLSDFRIANTAALGAGTRVLDTDAFAQLNYSAIATAGTPVTPGIQELFRAMPGDDPLDLVTNEGFILLGTAPATGTWFFNVDVSWSELAVGSW